MKEQTLEEAAEYKSHHSEEDFIRGGRWQAERMYSEEEVKYLLEVQRGNCYVALLSYTKNDDIASVALGAPEPGGRNGTWVK